jgi:hypothetical protein
VASERERERERERGGERERGREGGREREKEGVGVCGCVGARVQSMCMLFSKMNLGSHPGVTAN